MEDMIKMKSNTPEKGLKRSATLPKYTTIIRLELKSKYKEKKLFRNYSNQKFNENLDKSCITRANTTNLSNAQVVQVSAKKPKGRVKFAPDFKLVKHIDFNPIEPIYEDNNNKNKEVINKEKKDKKNEEKKEEIKKASNVTFQCTCIIF